MGRLLVVAIVIGVASSAAAEPEPGGNIAIDPFRPAIDSRGYLTIEASQPLGHGEVSFGLGALSWGHELLDAGPNRSVDDVLTATLVAAVGVRAGPAEFELGASAPFVVLAGHGVDGQGIGDVGLHLKTRFLETSRAPHVGLGLVASVFLPTASPSDRFLGDNQVVPQVIGVLDKEFGKRFRVSLNGGFRYRANHVGIESEVPLGIGAAWSVAPKKLEIVGEVIGAIPLGDHGDYQQAEAIAGVKVYLARNSFLSLGGGRGLARDKSGNPAVRAFIGIVFEPSLGDRDGDGLKDDVDKCPDDPEDFDSFEDEDGCPDPDNDRDRIPDVDDKCPSVPESYNGIDDEDGCPETVENDRDGDGIKDALDHCPDEPEDFDQFQDEDGCPDPDNDNDHILDVDDLCPNDPEDDDQFEDEDGCPDPDNDKDHIPDTLDRCPNEPEIYNGVEDADGCPDKGPIEYKGSIITTLEPINFEYNSAVIAKDSYHIVDAVVAGLKGNPEFRLVEVSGHTDERGDDAYNLDLSQRRAAAVEKYLVEHGIEEARLESQGYGETQPIDKRHTEKAWATNRRVEFLILKREP